MVLSSFVWNQHGQTHVPPTPHGYTHYADLSSLPHLEEISLFLALSPALPLKNLPLFDKLVLTFLFSRERGWQNQQGKKTLMRPEIWLDWDC